jgi:hypothetical protein
VASLWTTPTDEFLPSQLLYTMSKQRIFRHTLQKVPPERANTLNTAQTINLGVRIAEVSSPIDPDKALRELLPPCPPHRPGVYHPQIALWHLIFPIVKLLSVIWEQVIGQQVLPLH